MINKMQFVITNNSAFAEEIIPLGISLIFVRTFSLSNLLSAQRLNAMAALRAKTIHRIILKNRSQSMRLLFSSIESVGDARKNPIIAKGIAKMVWLNFIRDK